MQRLGSGPLMQQHQWGQCVAQQNSDTKCSSAAATKKFEYDTMLSSTDTHMLLTSRVDLVCFPNAAAYMHF
jgi:hypothetical protein